MRGAALVSALTDLLDLPRFKIALREDFTIHLHEHLFDDLGSRADCESRAEHDRESSGAG